jgi:cupin superfamily acireductone dioxygenase involved in methionine salvage
MFYCFDAESFAIMVIDALTKDKPYIDIPISSNSWIRTFDPTLTDSEEYIWHRDEKDRNVTVLDGTGWKIQFDDKIPQMININDIIFIPKNVYHRLILGKTKLRLKIEEIE